MFRTRKKHLINLFFCLNCINWFDNISLSEYALIEWKEQWSYLLFFNSSVPPVVSYILWAKYVKIKIKNYTHTFWTGIFSSNTHENILHVINCVQDNSKLARKINGESANPNGECTQKSYKFNIKDWRTFIFLCKPYRNVHVIF